MQFGMLNLIKNKKSPRQRKQQFVLYEMNAIKQRGRQTAGEFCVSQSKRPNEIYMCKKIYNIHFVVLFC